MSASSRRRQQIIISLFFSSSSSIPPFISPIWSALWRFAGLISKQKVLSGKSLPEHTLFGHGDRWRGQDALPRSELLISELRRTRTIMDQGPCDPLALPHKAGSGSLPVLRPESPEGRWQVLQTLQIKMDWRETLSRTRSMHPIYRKTEWAVAAVPPTHLPSGDFPASRRWQLMIKCIQNTTYRCFSDSFSDTPSVTSWKSGAFWQNESNHPEPRTVGGLVVLQLLIFKVKFSKRNKKSTVPEKFRHVSQTPNITFILTYGDWARPTATRLGCPSQEALPSHRSSLC